MPNNLYLSPDWPIILVKLVLCLVVGGVIGLERQRDHKPAGLRTHMLVCLGSTLFVMIPFHTPNNSVNPSQIIQGVIQGIGFIGAGEILRRSDPNEKKVHIHGLTSAAAIWVTAALGVSIAAGLYTMTIFGTLFTLFTLKILKKVEK